jgi:hypothetical protein
MSVTAQMVNSAITVIRDEAPTTRNKWLTLEAWKTILYHCYDLDDELGFSMNTLVRAVKLFGSAVDSKVRGGNSTGVHLRTQFLVKHDKDGKKSGTDQVRFLLLADSKEREPKQPTDIAGWIQRMEKSNAVVDKTSPLFVGIRAVPSFKDRATPGSSFNGTDTKISELREKIKKKVIRPSQDAVDANIAAHAARTAAAAPTATTEDPPSQDAVDANVARAAAAAPPSPPIPPSCWASHHANLTGISGRKQDSC